MTRLMMHTIALSTTDEHCLLLSQREYLDCKSLPQHEVVDRVTVDSNWLDLGEAHVELILHDIFDIVITHSHPM